MRITRIFAGRKEKPQPKEKLLELIVTDERLPESRKEQIFKWICRPADPVDDPHQLSLLREENNDWRIKNE